MRAGALIAMLWAPQLQGLSTGVPPRLLVLTQRTTLPVLSCRHGAPEQCSPAGVPGNSTCGEPTHTPGRCHDTCQHVLLTVKSLYTEDMVLLYTLQEAPGSSITIFR